MLVWWIEIRGIENDSYLGLVTSNPASDRVFVYIYLSLPKTMPSMVAAIINLESAL